MHNYDVVIIGCGIAGLTAALKLSSAKKKVAVLTRSNTLEESNSSLAQGGIVFSNNEADAFIKDIFKASNNSSNLETVTFLANSSGKILNEILLDTLKTPFERDDNNNLKTTLEAAHSNKRIIYHQDFTGKIIIESFFKYLKDNPYIDFLTNHTAIDLITPNHHGVDFIQRYENHKVVGAYVFDQKKEVVKKIMAKKVILATGGFAGLFMHHTNTPYSTGDGLAMAKRASAQITNIEFIQFHPTVYFSNDHHSKSLISEAVRGEGGKLINKAGQPFMHKYHPDQELAPRDVVSKAIVQEIMGNKNNCVFLDISHRNSDWIKNRFPSIYANCLSEGTDITKQPIPVVPAAHYTCGGIKTNLYGQTNVENLYAIGEVACTGIHGKNRLASTSLLEGLTFGYQAADSILKNLMETPLYPGERIKEWTLATNEVDLTLMEQDFSTLKQTMWNYLGIIRSTHRIKRAHAMLLELSIAIKNFYHFSKLNDNLISLRNASEVALMVSKALSQDGH